METILKFELPIKRLPKPDSKYRAMLPRVYRWFGWLFFWSEFTLGEFGGSRKNTRYQLWLLRRLIFTLHINEYHDRSDNERANEYLKKWSECEKELRGLRLLLLGDATNSEVKKVIRESFGVDLDEGRIQ